MLVLFLVGGIARVVFALMIRPMQDWVWVLASGLVAIACAVVLFANLPEAATRLLGALLGIELIAIGGAQACSPGASAGRCEPAADRPGRSAVETSGWRGQTKGQGPCASSPADYSGSSRPAPLPAPHPPEPRRSAPRR